MNNLIAHRLFNSYIGIPSNSYCHQTINNFKKLLDLKGIENIFPIIISIFVAIYIYIWLTRFLKNGISNIKYNLDWTIHKKLVII